MNAGSGYECKVSPAEEENRKQHLHTGSGVILHSVTVLVEVELTLHTLHHYALTDLQEQNTRPLCSQKQRGASMNKERSAL